MSFIVRSRDKELSGSGTDSRSNQRFWREPLIHFFILGLAVFGLHAFLDREPKVADADPYRVEVSSADIDWIRTQFNKQMGREPTVTELRRRVNQLIREHILSREAVSMGLDKGDVIVRRRLVQKIEFLFKDLSAMNEPTQEDLRRYFNSNQSAYERPARVTLTQVYFNSDSRGVDGARRAVQSLIEENIDPGSATRFGDTLILPAACRNCRMDEISKQFGKPFADAIMKIEPGTWFGPVDSAYGLHAVYIHERKAPELPVLQEVIDKVKSDWMFARLDENSRKVYGDMRSRYRVLVEGMPYDLDI